MAATGKRKLASFFCSSINCVRPVWIMAISTLARSRPLPRSARCAPPPACPEDKERTKETTHEKTTERTKEATPLSLFDGSPEVARGEELQSFVRLSPPSPQLLCPFPLLGPHSDARPCCRAADGAQSVQ